MIITIITLKDQDNFQLNGKDGSLTQLVQIVVNLLKRILLTAYSAAGCYGNDSEGGISMVYNLDQSKDFKQATQTQHPSSQLQLPPQQQNQTTRTDQQQNQLKN
ncbi:hypothetical protein ACTFIU_000743 [Dictyostelium citrinum]